METTIIIAAGTISAAILAIALKKIRSMLSRRKVREEIIDAIDGQIEARYYI